MMKILPVVLISFAAMHEVASAQTATWTENIACILYTRCTSCHHDGGIGPFSLMTYDDATAAAYGMQNAVNAGSMPPWPPDNTYRSFAHEQVLTSLEIEKINDWVNNGMPVGNSVPPMLPVYTSNEQIADPDLQLTMPSYTVNSTGNDVFRCFVMPTGLNQDAFISEIEVVPGNPSAVHHVLLYQDMSPTPSLLDALDPGPGYAGFGGTGSLTSRLIGGWAPGQGVKAYPQSMGVRISAGASIIMQVHYPTSANGQTDQTKINIKFTSGAVREVYFSTDLNHYNLVEGPLQIPANQVSAFTSIYQVPWVDATVLDVGAHMHLLGKSIRAWAFTPDGVTIPLIYIPKWDFHWQGFYDFRQPIKIPMGSIITGTAVYDNTASNPNNPNNPPQDVGLGEATTDEMMALYFSYVYYQPGDENIVVDTSSVVSTHNGCDFTAVGVAEEQAFRHFSAYPNPTNGQLYLNLPQGEQAMIRLIDPMGKVVMQRQFAHEAIDVSEFANGLYQVQVEMNGATSSRKVLIQQ